MSSTHRCFQCEAKTKEIDALRAALQLATEDNEQLLADNERLRLQLDAARTVAAAHRDGHERQMQLMAELQQSSWIGSAGDMVD